MQSFFAAVARAGGGAGAPRPPPPAPSILPSEMRTASAFHAGPSAAAAAVVPPVHSQREKEGRRRAEMEGGGEKTRRGATGGGHPARGGRIGYRSAEVSEVSPCGCGRTVRGIHDGVMASSVNVCSARRRPGLVERIPKDDVLSSVSLWSTRSVLRVTPKHRRWQGSVVMARPA